MINKHNQRNWKCVNKIYIVITTKQENIMQTQWTRLYPIIEKIYENDYKIKIKGKLKVFHANRKKGLLKEKYK